MRSNTLYHMTIDSIMIHIEGNHVIIAVSLIDWLIDYRLPWKRFELNKNPDISQDNIHEKSDLTHKNEYKQCRDICKYISMWIFA